MKAFDTSFLFKEVSASSLGILRLLFGLILLEDYVNFHQYFMNYLEPSGFYNTYDLFHWVHLMPRYWIDIFFYGAMASCILFSLGIHYRLNAVLTFLSWTYIFLIDKGHYNNHFYLVSILLFFFCITDADRWASLTKKEKTTVPYWQVCLFRWQIALVYFYGGLAKIQWDWLHGFPMCYWLPSAAHKYPEFMQAYMITPTFTYLFAYGGLVFDLCVPFLLLSDKWRRWALIAVVAFHTLNDHTWNIGDFPTIMLASTPIFFAPSWAAQFYERIKPKRWVWVGLAVLFAGAVGYGLWLDDLFHGTNRYFKMLSYPVLLYLFFHGNGMLEKERAETPSFFSRKRASIVFLSIWFSFQLLFPFRQWLYKGNPSWTGEGHLFAWRMMLVDTADAWRMRVIIPETGEEFPVALNEYINYRQYRKMRRTPKSFLRFAHFIRDELKANGVKDPIIKMEIWKSVNNRTPQLVNDTTLNYAEVPYSSVAPATWLTEWSELDEQPEFSANKLELWQDFLTKDGSNYEWR